MADLTKHTYHTIGEVLALLEPEFPDVSISKIRFLESQGLVEPQRTPSGYRKFAKGDIDRLRFVLSEQRDNYLPLKVIKERLERWERGELSQEQADPVHRNDSRTDQASIDGGPKPVSLGLGELAAVSHLSESKIAELERHGLLRPQVRDGDTFFDEIDLLIARIAKGFDKYGIEARHLRTFRHTADRETYLFDQVLTPLRAQGSPDSQRRASQALAELATLSKQLHQALLVQYFRDHRS